MTQRIYYTVLSNGDYVYFPPDLSEATLGKKEHHPQVVKLLSLLRVEMHDLSQVPITGENLEAVKAPVATLLRLDGDGMSYFTFDNTVRRESQLKNSGKVIAVHHDHVEGYHTAFLGLGIRIKQTSLLHG